MISPENLAVFMRECAKTTRLFPMSVAQEAMVIVIAKHQTKSKSNNLEHTINPAFLH